VLAAHGVPVACVTTKDKLRRLLAAGGVPCLSAERIGEQRLPELGIEHPAELVGRPAPGIYDPECSIYALELGLALARRLGPCLLYVSLTDAVQHLQGPGRPVASRFYERLDEQWGAYLDAGLRVALVADHGMNAKPRILYLEDELSESGIRERRVVLPITDPYVVHHAALGSAAWVHVPDGARSEAAACLRTLDGVDEVLEREQAATELELPVDRIGDLVVLADERTALGSSRARHDLSTLRGPLRSHGGRHEQAIPIVISHPLTPEAASRLEGGVTNADVHDLLLNGLA
jgi:phosphonoacetate hydrolase